MNSYRELYRGITVSPDVLGDPEAFSAALQAREGLQPGSSRIDDAGQQCVSTGDEYGVYLTPERSMAESYGYVSLDDQRAGLGYPFTRQGEQVAYHLPDPYDHQREGLRATLMLPSVGIVYAVNPTGLALRMPRYRPGRIVTADEQAIMPELITDRVPADHVRPVGVIIGPDIVNPAKVRFDPAEEAVPLYERVSSAFQGRVGSLAFFAEQLNAFDAGSDPNMTEQVLSLARRMA